MTGISKSAENRKKVAAGSTDYGDISTLTNPEIMEEIVKGSEGLK